MNIYKLHKLNNSRKKKKICCNEGNKVHDIGPCESDLCLRGVSETESAKKNYGIVPI